MTGSVHDIARELEAQFPDDLDGAVPAGFSDEALALEFAKRHAGALRYVAAWGRWFQWSGARWAEDSTLAAFDLARAVCREYSERAMIEPGGKRGEAIAAAVASAKTVAAVERLAKADRRLAATVDQWDSDIWLLNTPGGVVDLRTGSIRPNDPLDYCTKSTATAPAPEGTPAPMWGRFLLEVMEGDVELVRFLQRMAGYALTGCTREHAMFFGFGGGRNGKTVFLNTLARIWGEYCTIAAMESFVEARSERHPTDLASMRGARLVVASETREGQRWDEVKVKTLTGGDPISARFMRQDYFTFQPQFKLLVVGNHRPGLRAVDLAIASRLNLIPFLRYFQPHERDPELPEKLEAEWPAILRWAIEGTAAWLRDGLQAPEAVRAATSDYLDDQDAIQQWLDECCEPARGERSTSTALFDSWRTWAEKREEYIGTMRRFSQALQARGFQPYKDRDGRGLQGLRIMRGGTQ